MLRSLKGTWQHNRHGRCLHLAGDFAMALSFLEEGHRHTTIHVPLLSGAFESHRDLSWQTGSVA